MRKVYGICWHAPACPAGSRPAGEALDITGSEKREERSIIIFTRSLSFDEKAI